MSSIQLPEDIEILRMLQTPKLRYEVMKELGNHYVTIRLRIARLERLGLVFVSREEQWRTGKTKKYYLITTKGRSFLRGYEESGRAE